MTRTRLPGLSSIAAATLAAGLVAATPARGESLADAIAHAYQTNPTLLAQRSEQQITDETYVQARAGYRPQASVQVVGQRQDYTGETSNTGSALAIITQPLYTGGRTASAVAASQADILSGRETLRGVEASVLQQVITAYADVLRDQESVAIRQQNLNALNEQLAEFQARNKAGDATRTDVAQSQGFMLQARVDLASARSQLQLSRSTYVAVVGLPAEGLEPLPGLPALPKGSDQAVKTAELGNPALRSSLYNEQGARLRTEEARDQRLPTVSLQAQLGSTGPVSVFTPNIYARDAVATVTVTQPLFSGGVINSQVRQQKHREAVAHLETEQAQRAIVQQVTSAWSAYVEAQENTATADEQVKANQDAYEGVQMELRADLRSTLEVFYIEQSLRQAQLNASAARHDAYVAASNLLGTMGLLNAKTLTPGLTVYDPEKPFREVSHKGSVPWEALPEALDSLTTSRLRRLPAAPSQPVGAPDN
jgi:outer membrane protein